MSLDATTGTISFDDGLRLDPAVPLVSFLSSPLAAVATVVVPETEPWPTFRIDHRAFGGVPWSANVVFQGQRMYAVRLTRDRDGAGGWDSWSETAELALRADYDTWLDSVLGPGQRHFSWGSASAIFDQRAAATYIDVRFG